MTEHMVVISENEFVFDILSHEVFMADGVVEEEGSDTEIFSAPELDKTGAFLSRFLC